MSAAPPSATEPVTENTRRVMLPNVRVAAVVQARMSSVRCPGKVLRPLAGRPLLDHLLHRLARARAIDAIVVATSDQVSDDPVAAFCADVGVAIHRGDLHDVAGRLAAAARSVGAEVLVRVSGDSPLLDPRIVDEAVRLFDPARHDLVSNVFPRSFPVGQSVEVIDRGVLEAALAEMERPDQREHVTPLFYERPERYRIGVLRHDPDLSSLRMTVDTEDDARRMDDLLRRLGARDDHAGLEELVSLLGSPAG